MKIVKKLNNNVVLALNDKDEEIIVVGKGLGFRKTPYVLEELSLIEKKYVIPENTKAFDILDSIPSLFLWIAKLIWSDKANKITSIMGEILNLIKYKFKIEFDEDSFEFTRFVTHIRYFIMRQVNNKPLENENSDMFTLMQDKLTEELECVEMIEKHLNKNYGWKCTNDEKLYLILHIQRIRKQNN